MVQIALELDDLKIQLQTKDMVICDLERELRENIQLKKKVIDSTCLDIPDHKGYTIGLHHNTCLYYILSRLKMFCEDVSLLVKLFTISLKSYLCFYNLIECSVFKILSQVSRKFLACIVNKAIECYHFGRFFFTTG